MISPKDGQFRPWLQDLRLAFSSALLFLLLSACAGPSGAGTPPDLTSHWPPDNPRQAGRLGSPLATGEDPLVWWKATFFDTLPEGIYQDKHSTQVALALVKETNERRIVNGVGTVSEDIFLDRVAQAHARDEAIRDYWNHRSPEGMGSHDRVLSAGGFTVSAGGENSAVLNSLVHDTALVVIHGFENHVGHRDLLLNTQVQRIGIGIYQYAPNEQVHIVQLLMTY